jgi:hypothetical protein
MRRTYVSFALFLTFVVSALSAIAEAAPNPGILYSDHSYNYAVGYPNLDFPTVYVGRGQMCLITINRGEELNVKDNVPVIVADRTRWTVIGSRSGGQRLPNGETVPVTWGVAVQPAQDADDTWLTINTEMGNRYIVHLMHHRLTAPEPHGTLEAWKCSAFRGRSRSSRSSSRTMPPAESTLKPCVGQRVSFVHTASIQANPGD